MFSPWVGGWRVLGVGLCGMGGGRVGGGVGGCRVSRVGDYMHSHEKLQ